MGLKKDLSELLKKNIEHNKLAQYGLRVDLEHLRQARKNATGDKLNKLGQAQQQMLNAYMELRNQEVAFKKKLNFLKTYQDREPEIPQSSSLEL